MTAPTRPRDYQRAKVYAAEQALRFAYDHPADTITIAGVTLSLEPEDRFASLADLRVYVDRVIYHPEVIATFGFAGPVGVRHRKGAAKAHYQHHDAVIAVPVTGSGWALRELVVLHELAHHLAPGAQHGPEFTAAFVDLVQIIIGPQAALALRLLLHEQGAS